MRKAIRVRARAAAPFLTTLSVAAALAVPAGPEARAHAQETLRVRHVDGRVDTLRAEAPRGFQAVPLRALGGLGWTFEFTADGAVGRGEDLPEVRIRAGNPYVRWGSDLLQLAYAPFVAGRELWVPLQFATDQIPVIAPDRFRFEAGPGVLGMRTPGSDPAAPPAVVRTRAPSDTRVIVIDPGHGGRDSGTRGPNGVFEKDVALDVGLLLADILSRREGYEVHLTRDTDVLIPVWDRGELATHLKGDRPGLFISIHANSWPQDRSVRGFETYFLSEARTEHERRVTALENSPIEGGGPQPVQDADPELGFILNELRNLDYAHWSSLLAEMVQGEMADVHPGPNRGVKQGPLAVITNALMPGVLIELGFVSNRQEERLLRDAGFQADVAEAIATAVDRFFERYPPGTDLPAGRDGREP
jgi:N-acetylmuramoyl-L-alanine amidase